MGYRKQFEDMQLFSKIIKIIIKKRNKINKQIIIIIKLTSFAVLRLVKLTYTYFHRDMSYFQGYRILLPTPTLALSSSRSSTSRSLYMAAGEKVDRAFYDFTCFG